MIQTLRSLLTVCLIFSFSFPLLFPGFAQAEAPQVTIAYKAWYNTWKMKFGDGELPQSDFKVIDGPAISVRWFDFFISGSVLAGSLGTASGKLKTTSVEIDAAFEEVDLGVGYYVTNWFAPYLGHKAQSLEFTTRAGGTVQSGRQRLGIPMFGLLFNQALTGSRLTLFVNAARLGSGSGDADGWHLETGLSYGAVTLPVSGYLGVQYERFNLNAPVDSVVINGDRPEAQEYLGLIGGINYTF